MAERRRRRISGIRARTVTAACLIVAVAVTMAAVLLVVVLQRTMLRELDSSARTRAREVADLVEQDTLPEEVASLGRDDALVQVVDGSGRVVASSANVRGRPAMASFRPAGNRAKVRTFHDLPLEHNSDDAFRVVALAALGPHGPVTVYVGTNLEHVDGNVATARQAMFLAVPLVIALVGAATWLGVGRALRPVDAIRSEVADINASDLGRRVPEPSSDDEIGRLARTMNEMLDRLQSFTDRQRRFVADASHELQSPLAASLADLEVALAHPDAGNWQRTATELVQDNQRMTRLVNDLLFLARADERSVGVPPTPVDLDDVVLAEVGRLRSHLRVELDTSAVAPAEVRGNADQLARVVRNLLENASRYASHRVAVELVRHNGEARLVVTDDGPGVPAQDAERIFERFARVDGSRSRDTGGVGLGLAIAREIVERHGGSIALASNGPGARFVIRLPAAD